jgi:hypothetical protein
MLLIVCWVGGFVALDVGVVSGVGVWEGRGRRGWMVFGSYNLYYTTVPRSQLFLNFSYYK